MSGLRGPLLLFILLVVGGSVVFALRGQNGPAGVAEVPWTLPAAGVDVGGQIVLKPLANAPTHALSRAAAIAKARSYATSKPFPAKALEASLTEPGSTHLQDVPAWVVTFTSPKATDVGQGGKGVLVRHYSVALGLTSGAFLVGFFTK